MNAYPDHTHAVCERQATEYDRRRSMALFEARWLARFAASPRPGDLGLDLGSGAGNSIACWFMAEGFDVTRDDFCSPSVRALVKQAALSAKNSCTPRYPRLATRRVWKKTGCN